MFSPPPNAICLPSGDASIAPIDPSMLIMRVGAVSFAVADTR
jgi:hypothetical protein